MDDNKGIIEDNVIIKNIINTHFSNQYTNNMINDVNLCFFNRTKQYINKTVRASK